MFIKLKIQGHDHRHIRDFLAELGGEVTMLEAGVEEDWRKEEDSLENNEFQLIYWTTVNSSRKEISRTADRHQIQVWELDNLIPTIVQSSDGWVFFLGRDRHLGQPTGKDELYWIALDGTIFPWSETHQLLMGDEKVDSMPLEQQPFMAGFKILRVESVIEWNSYSDHYHPYDVCHRILELPSSEKVEINQLKKVLNLSTNCPEPIWWQIFWEKCSQDSETKDNQIWPDNLDFLFSPPWKDSRICNINLES